MFSLLILFCFTAYVVANPAISLYECPSGDDACVTHAAQIAYPLVLNENSDIGAKELDPMFLKIIEANLATLKFKLFNTTLIGLRDCRVENAKYMNAEEIMHIHLICPHLNLEGQYELKGTVLGLAVEGKGDYFLTGQTYSLKVDIDLNTVNKDGKNYRQVKSFKLKVDPLGPLTYDLRNLFNGQKELAEPFLKLVNENWKDVAYELQDPVFEVNVKSILDNANKYLQTLPIDEYTMV